MRLITLCSREHDKGTILYVFQGIATLLTYEIAFWKWYALSDLCRDGSFLSQDHFPGHQNLQSSSFDQNTVPGFHRKDLAGNYGGLPNSSRFPGELDWQVVHNEVS